MLLQFNVYNGQNISTLLMYLQDVYLACVWLLKQVLLSIRKDYKFKTT